MRRLAPYQSGLWLAEYGDVRCQLCRIYRSTPQSQLPQNHSSAIPPNNHSFFTMSYAEETVQVNLVN